MATHALGANTGNLSINLPREERQIWGHVAFDEDARSTGDFIRRMALVGLRSVRPEAAAQISEIRSKRRAARSGVLLGLFLVGLASGDLGEIRRAPRGVRVGRRRDDVEEVAA